MTLYFPYTIQYLTDNLYAKSLFIYYDYRQFKDCKNESGKLETSPECETLVKK